MVSKGNKHMTSKNKYFKVTAKCGHVGKGNYVPVAFAVKAESRSAASQKVMTYHRVKKQLSDAIISCEEIDRDSYKELMQVILTLPPGFRTVFNLYSIEGYSHKEIGEMLGISETTSRTQLSRARLWLQRKLKELENV
jgi:DNA-directed RNA polymerase specialized sigma24 family protein